MTFFHYSIICSLTSICLYLYGFFLLNYDGNTSSLPNNSFNTSKMNPASVDKLVLVIIDGIRLDFVIGDNVEKNMPFIHSSIKSNLTCVFPCRVHLPTVTMPRIKALTVGTVPSFVDIVMNFGSSHFTKDSILKQMVWSGKKIVFYGDDTWIKLFPGMFSRYEGTTSFFVADFVEVDNNVTRNVYDELKRDDWDVMILHYLGLDHIGHVEGSTSSKIEEKLQEMDMIVEKLNLHLLNWEMKTHKNYLMVICGDHGMKDSGGHGGSTIPEIMVPFITFGVPCIVHGEISQVDVAVTLSTLLGVPIPNGNVGKLIKGLLYHLNVSERAAAYHYNSQQLMNKFMKVAGDSELFDARNSLEKATMAYHQGEYIRAIQTYEILMNKMHEALIRSLTKYDSLILYCAILLAIQSCFLVCIHECSKIIFMYAVPLTSFINYALYEYCSYFQCDSILCSSGPSEIILSWVILYVLSFNTVLLLKSTKSLLKRYRIFFTNIYKDSVMCLLFCGSIAQICSSTSSSFIEEEHMIWYFLWTTLLMLVTLRHYTERAKLVVLVFLLISHRVFRKLNQTGDKWSALPDINDWFRIPDNRGWLSVYTLLGLIWTFFALHRIEMFSRIKQSLSSSDLQFVFKFIDTTCLLLIFMCKAAMDEVTFPETLKFILSHRGSFEFQSILILQFASVFLKLILHKLKKVEDRPVGDVLEIFIKFLIVLSSLLLRPYNIILIGSLYITSKLLIVIFKNELNLPYKLVISHYWLAQVYFFYQGNSNSFSSIDVTPGYVGQRSYNPVVAGILIVYSIYALPILAYVCMIQQILIYSKESDRSVKKRLWIQSPAALLLFVLNLNLALFMTITAILRNHLFIWSVFSPKLVYVCAYNLLMYPVLICLQYCLND